MSENFKVYLLSPDFHGICDWSIYKIPTKENRPVILLAIEAIEDQRYPDSLCCIPISKDDDKDDKYKKLFERKPDLVHPIAINEYDNYLLIQNMFYVKKEFIGAPFLVNGIHSEIKDNLLKKTISKKAKKINALINLGKLNYVNREEVYRLQVEFINKPKFFI